MAEDFNIFDAVSTSLDDIPAQYFQTQFISSSNSSLHEDIFNVPAINTQQPIISQSAFSQPMEIPLFSNQSKLSEQQKTQPDSQVKKISNFMKSLQPQKNSSSYSNSFHPPCQKDPTSQKSIQSHCRGEGGNFLQRPITEVPERFRTIFSKFPYFNKVQSKVFDDVMYSDKPIVVASPTGSGKTVIFELAIIRLLSLCQSSLFVKNIKIVYMAPLKALCFERHEDWQEKFNQFGLKCIHVTGDSNIDNYAAIRSSNIIMTTPEKWDSITRRWREHLALMQEIVLFLIDEAHMVGDVERGSTIEAVVSRMKCIKDAAKTSLRFIAISATIPNAEDFAAWLTSGDTSAICFKLDESYRPVPLQKIVLSYNNCTPSTSYKFDLNLNYKLHSIIQQYSPQSPTIIFCATRKSTVQAAVMLQKEKRFVFNTNDRIDVRDRIGNVVDGKLRDLMQSGIAYHHAGLTYSDRQTVESLFISGFLPVICATSTLAMGVNLPAHLVIVKSTMHYVGGIYKEYTASNVLQMIGRAGRPQYDTSAIAVIMTQHSTKAKYEDLIGGSQIVESSFHLNLTDHLNAEVVLKTLTEVSVAIQWMKSTFLYVRVLRNPSFYKLPNNVTKANIETFLESTVLKGLKDLCELGLILHESDNSLAPTESGSLMANYCIAFNTMKSFTALNGSETVADILNIISNAQELVDIQLRANEKSTLNALNKSKIGPVVRYTFPNKIKTRDMKINILIQATLGCLPISDFALNQEAARIMMVAARLSRCLVELQNHNTKTALTFNSYTSSLILMKCLGAKLWENSKFVARQLPNIGPAISNMLVNAGFNNINKLVSGNPREIELITNKNPPFGSTLIKLCQEIPQYELYVRQLGEQDLAKASLEITIKSTNMLAPEGKTISLIIGTPENYLVYKRKFKDLFLFEQKEFKCQVQVHRRVDEQKIILWLVNHWYVGCDIKSTFNPTFKQVIENIPQNRSDYGARLPQSNYTPLAKTPYSVSSSSMPNIDQKLQNSSRISMNKERPSRSITATPHNATPSLSITATPRNTVYQQHQQVYNVTQSAHKPITTCHTVVINPSPVTSATPGPHTVVINPTPVTSATPGPHTVVINPSPVTSATPGLRPQVPVKSILKPSSQQNQDAHQTHTLQQTKSSHQVITQDTYISDLDLDEFDVDPAELDDDLTITGLDDLDDSGFCEKNVSGFELGLDSLLASSQFSKNKEIESGKECKKRTPNDNCQPSKYVKISNEDNALSKGSEIRGSTSYDQKRKYLGDITNTSTFSTAHRPNTSTFGTAHRPNTLSTFDTAHRPLYPRPNPLNPGPRPFNPDLRPLNPGPRLLNTDQRPFNQVHRPFNQDPYISSVNHDTSYSKSLPSNQLPFYPDNMSRHPTNNVNQSNPNQSNICQSNPNQSNICQSNQKIQHTPTSHKIPYQPHLPTLNMLYETTQMPHQPSSNSSSNIVKGVEYTGNSRTENKSHDPHPPMKIFIGEDGEEYRECGHKCADKTKCSHFCCRYGVRVKKTKCILKSAEGIDKTPYKMSPQVSAPQPSVPQVSEPKVRVVYSLGRTENMRLPQRREPVTTKETIHKVQHTAQIPHSSMHDAQSIVPTHYTIPSHSNVPSLKDKYFSKLSDELPVRTVESTQPPTPDISFYNQATSGSIKSTFDSIFDGIF